MKLRLPSPSFVVAAVALSLAMGGVGYAAGSLPKNSVGSKQLKNNAVTAAKLQPGAVTSDKIPDGGLTGADLAAGSLTGAQVAPNSLTGAQVAPNSLTGSQVAPNSLGGAQIDESSLAIPSKPGSIILTGYDFQPRDSSYEYITLGQGSIWTSSSNASFAAPIEIPAGATVTGVKVFVLDDGVADISAYIGRFVPSTGASTYSSPFSSSGTASFVRTISSAPFPVIAGSTQDLTVFLPIGDSYKLFGAQIDYQ